MARMSLENWRNQRIHALLVQAITAHTTAKHKVHLQNSFVATELGQDQQLLVLECGYEPGA